MLFCLQYELKQFLCANAGKVPLQQDDNGEPVCSKYFFPPNIVVNTLIPLPLKSAPRAEAALLSFSTAHTAPFKGCSFYSYLGRPPLNRCGNLRWFCTHVKPLQNLFGLATTNVGWRSAAVCSRAPELLSKLAFLELPQVPICMRSCRKHWQ